MTLIFWWPLVKWPEPWHFKHKLPTYAISFLDIQGVPILMDVSIACNNKKIGRSVYGLFIDGAPCFSSGSRALRHPTNLVAQRRYRDAAPGWADVSQRVPGPSRRPCTRRSPRGFRWASGLGCCQVVREVIIHWSHKCAGSFRLDGKGRVLANAIMWEWQSGLALCASIIAFAALHSWITSWKPQVMRTEGNIGR